MSAPTDISLVRALIAERRMRKRYFPSDLFADPAWDLLLALYLAQLSQHLPKMTDLYDSANAPGTTALRWIQTLRNRGFAKIEPDRLDARVRRVGLTPTGLDAMKAYCEEVGSTGKEIAHTDVLSANLGRLETTLSSASNKELIAELSLRLQRS